MKLVKFPIQTNRIALPGFEKLTRGSVSVPTSAVVLQVGADNKGTISVWALVPDEQTPTRTFECIVAFEGQDLPSGYAYRGVVRNDPNPPLFIFVKEEAASLIVTPGGRA